MHISLPDRSTLRPISQSLALLDAILSPDWDYRYYFFNAHWADQQAAAWMGNGEGDSYTVWFSPDGVVLKGFAHESPMSPYRVKPPQLWPGLLDSFPAQLSRFWAEPAFMLEETTFCFWQTVDDPHWQSGAVELPDGQDPDGSASLLRLLDGMPQTYQQWAAAYYEIPVELSAVAHIYAHRPLSDSLIKTLNPDLLMQDLAADLTEIGYGA